MSRIGKRPIPLPTGVSATIDGSTVTIKGPKGTLTRTLPADMLVSLEANEVKVDRPSEATRHKALHGLSRTLVANMVEGVANGYVKTLELQGVGYKAEPKPYGVNLVVGLSHQVQFKAPDGIELKVETPTILKIIGINKELVGQVAAEIRSVRPPEPYKGKGIRYQGEQVRRKAGKTGAK
ncbi:MAG TPA: 50S ribosomal protein L6 [Gemmatimonadales bacterium]|nr:50S ribosomal protein L6 [Gemmatimonadales bacterium]